MQQVVSTDVGCREPLPLCSLGLGVFGMNDVADSQRAQLAPGETEHPTQTSVGLDDSTTRVDKRHRVRRVFEGGGKQRLARRVGHSRSHRLSQTKSWQARSSRSVPKNIATKR